MRLEYNVDKQIDSYGVLREEDGGKSKVTKFKEYLEQLLASNGDSYKVEVFSIKEDIVILQLTDKPVVDLRFTAYSDNNYLSEFLYPYIIIRTSLQNFNACLRIVL